MNSELNESELRYVFITSKVTLRLLPYPESEPFKVIEEPNLDPIIKRSPHDPCVRCKHHRVDVKPRDGYEDANSPDGIAHMCDRCMENIEGDGEVRRYA